MAKCALFLLLFVGEEPLSCGYGGTGKISQNMEFTDYGVPFQLNDVVGVYMVHVFTLLS